MWQEGFRPEDLQHKTMRTMEKHIQDAMMPDYEMYEVDLTEGTKCFTDLNKYITLVYPSLYYHT